MKKDEILGIGILAIILVVGIVSMCLRAEQIDTKKELSNPTQTEIR